MTKIRLFSTIAIIATVLVVFAGCASRNNLFALPAAQAGTTKAGQTVLPLVIREMTDKDKGQDIATKVYGQEGGIEPQIMVYNGASLSLVTPAMKDFAVCQATLLTEHLKKGEWLKETYIYLFRGGVDVTPPSPCGHTGLVGTDVRGEPKPTAPAVATVATLAPSTTGGSGLGVNDAAARKALSHQPLNYKPIGIIRGVEAVHVTGLKEDKGCGNPCVAAKWYKGTRLQLMFYNMGEAQAREAAKQERFLAAALAVPRPENPLDDNYTSIWDGCSNGLTQPTPVAAAPQPAPVVPIVAPAAPAPAPPTPPVAQAKAPAAAAPAADLETTVKASGGSVTTDAQGKTVLIMNEDILFATGSATLSAKGKAFVKKIAGALTTCQAILVSGHTDNVPIHNQEFADNNALSEARAKAVAAELAANGVPRALIVAIGYGESRPVASNATAEGRARNRRVEIRLN